jgi:hypothetical protein
MTPDWLHDNAHRLTQPAGMAVLGYGLTAFAGQRAHTGPKHLLPGLAALRRRNPFPRDGVTSVNEPGQIVGFTLVVNTVAAEDAQRFSLRSSTAPGADDPPKTPSVAGPREGYVVWLGCFGGAGCEVGGCSGGWCRMAWTRLSSSWLVKGFSTMVTPSGRVPFSVRTGPA